MQRLKELIEKGMLIAESSNEVLKSSSQSILSLPPLQESAHLSGYAKYVQSEREIVSSFLFSYSML